VRFVDLSHWEATLITKRSSLERIQEYANVEQEPKPTHEGVPPVYWPPAGNSLSRTCLPSTAPTVPKSFTVSTSTLSSAKKGFVGSGAAPVHPNGRKCSLRWHTGGIRIRFHRHNDALRGAGLFRAGVTEEAFQSIDVISWHLLARVIARRSRPLILDEGEESPIGRFSRIPF